MKYLLFFPFIAIFFQSNGQAVSETFIQCDTIKLEGGRKTPCKIQEVNSRELAYFACCDSCNAAFIIQAKYVKEIVWSEETRDRLDGEPDTTSIKKSFGTNSFFADLGINPIGYFEASLTYESLPSHNLENLHKAIGYQISAGTYAVWGDGGPFVRASAVYLLGKKNHHLEFNGGLTGFLNGDLAGINGLSPLAGFGYRFQSIRRPHSPVFRVGISWPQGLHFGLGFSF